MVCNLSLIRYALVVIEFKGCPDEVQRLHGSENRFFCLHTDSQRGEDVQYQ